MKSSQSNLNLRSPGSYLVRSYLITTVPMQQYEVNLKVLWLNSSNDNGIVMRNVCRGTVLDQNRVMTSASCLEINKYLLDPNRRHKQLHFQIDFGKDRFGNEVRRNITYFVSHPGYHYAKVETM